MRGALVKAFIITCGLCKTEETRRGVDGPAALKEWRERGWRRRAQYGYLCPACIDLAQPATWDAFRDRLWILDIMIHSGCSLEILNMQVPGHIQEALRSGEPITNSARQALARSYPIPYPTLDRKVTTAPGIRRLIKRLAEARAMPVPELTKAGHQRQLYAATTATIEKLAFELEVAPAMIADLYRLSSNPPARFAASQATAGKGSPPLLATDSDSPRRAQHPGAPPPP